MSQEKAGIRHVVREETLFAGWREPIKNRADLEPRIAAVTRACENAATGPLTHILRYDTPVDGFDSEIGFPVSEPVNEGPIHTHALRRLDFFSTRHVGSIDTLHEASRLLYGHMNRVGLAPELESVEIYHSSDSGGFDSPQIEVLASFLAWPEVYRAQLLRVLGTALTNEIWQGGEAITPFTDVDTRAAWVGRSLERLKRNSTSGEQFDILSRVALVRPAEDTAKYRAIYEESGHRVESVLDAQNKVLEKTRTGGWIDPPYYNGEVLHLSKVAYDREAYQKAGSPDALRHAYCFCPLVREAKNPHIDPIFCYRAAGWARQFWEPILGVEFKRCDITHSILKGDRFCAWDYHLP
jgi:hypothetical protein